MLSGALCWDVLEDQLLHTRTSSDKIRKIFDFAIEQRAILKEDGSARVREEVGKRKQYFSSSSGLGYMADTATVMMTTTTPDKEHTHPELIFSTQDTPQTSPKANTNSVATSTESRQIVCGGSHHSWLSTKRSREKFPLHQEAVSTLGALMDLSTHLYNYPVPVDTSLARFVVAEQDLYIPRQHIASVQDTWPGKRNCKCTM